MPSLVMTSSLKIATVSSILFALVAVTVQLPSQITLKHGKPKPENLTPQLPQLFEEFTKKDPDMLLLAENYKIHTPTVDKYFEVTSYKEGPLRCFVVVRFNTSKIPSDPNEKDTVYAVTLVMGRIDTKTTNVAKYYLITGGKMIYFDDIGFKATGIVSPNPSALEALKRMESTPDVVIWDDGVWPDVKRSSIKEVEKEIKTSLQLQSISVSLDHMGIEYRRHGSIQSVGHNFRFAVCQLIEESSLQPVVAKNKLKTVMPTSDPKSSSSRTTIGQQLEKQTGLFFCVVLKKERLSTKVLYSSKLTLYESEAIVDAENFRTNYIIWTKKEGKTGFNKLLDGDNENNLPLRVAKALIRKNILTNRLIQYMNIAQITFPSKLESFVDLVLDTPRTVNEASLTENEMPEDLLPLLKNANTDVTKLTSNLNLKLLKVNDLTTSTTNQTLYWFEFKYNNKTLQCVARTTTNTSSMTMNLDITDIFQDSKYFLVQTRTNINELFTNLIPLYWHLPGANVFHPRLEKNAVAIFNINGFESYLPQIQATIQMAEIKENLPKKFYSLSNAKFASRIKPGYEDAVQTGVYFKVTFSDNRVCYLICVVLVNAEGKLEFTLPENSSLYDTEEETTDAMETILKEVAI